MRRVWRCSAVRRSVMELMGSRALGRPVGPAGSCGATAEMVGWGRPEPTVEPVVPRVLSAPVAWVVPVASVLRV